ncbi:MAG: hypothetical protein J1E16_03900 [Muribaculaceae bacterium]|nr:hypothetical protein [Muribaculaceae bacterium]
MKLFKKYTTVALMGIALAGSFALTSCNDDNGISTQQYTGGINLNVWGPCPVARGGELRFLGSGLDQVTAISLPGSEKITDIKRISNEEIRITVPQDAEEGYVTVHTSKGDITTKTLISYLEPISVENISPLKVKAGETITITGEYLNNIHEVIFSADKTNPDASVPEEDFISHSRQEISLTVPAEAKTGVLILSDANEEMPNWIITESEITVITPSVAEIQTLEKANPGDVITITGSDLDLVVALVMANGEEIDFTYNEKENETRAVGNEGSITFTIPENACNGPISMVTASGLEIVAVNIGECQPTDLIASPADELRGGNDVAISGKNLQMVSSVAVPTASGYAEVEFKLESNEKMTLVFPSEGQSGDVLLALKGGGEVFLELATAKPDVLTTDQLPAGAETTLVGKNLDLLVLIKFADGSVAEVNEPKADQVTVTIPVTAQSGIAVLNMANGETADWEANIAAPTGAYVVEGPSDEDEILAGTLAKFTIGNPEALSGIKVNGESVQYILNGTTLYVSLPESCGKGTIVTLESSDGSSLDYTYNFIPATKVSMVIWSDVWECAGWGGNQDLAWGGFDWTSVPAGAILTIYMTPTVDDGGWWCISLRHGDSWGNIPGLNDQYDTPENGILSVVLTQSILDDLNTNGGLVITGDGFIMNKVEVEWENSMETVIWEGSFDSSGWAGNQDLAWGGFDWSTVKAGTVLRAYCTPNDPSAWWCVSFRHGDGWANLPGDVGAQIDSPEGGVAEIILSQEIIDDLNVNGGLVITGDGYVMTKVTLE